MADDGNEQLNMVEGVIGATTLVGLPAFPDAYVVLDGQTIEPNATALAASATPMWRSSDLGDVCSPCLAGKPLPDEIAPRIAEELKAAAPPPTAADRYPTSGMVALMPDNPEAFTVPGGDPADEMHCTVMYLGDDLDQWTPQEIADVHSGVQQAIAAHNTDDDMDPEDVAEGPEDGKPDAEDIAEGSPFADASGPAAQGNGPAKPTIPHPRPKPGGAIKAHVLGPSLFNPHGGKTGKQTPAAVHLLGDSQDVNDFAAKVQQHVTDAVANKPGGRTLPEQHKPFTPHVTAKQSPDAAKVLPKLNHPGPVKFGKVRVATPQHTVDYPLNGGKPSMVASAAPLPAAHFADPQLTKPTPLTFTDDGRVFGHIATWGTCHIGFGGQCVTPPRSASQYAYFHTGEVLTDAGPVATGHLTFATGHASGKLSAASTVRHYDDTGTVGADVVCGEDQHGIWVSGSVRDALTASQLRAFRAAPPSGDWRNIGGVLELVAVLGVNTPGFPVPRARVASGVPLALVAAGMINEAPVQLARRMDDPTVFAREVLRLMDERDRLAQARIATLAELAEVVAEPVDDLTSPVMDLMVGVELLAEGETAFNWVDDAGGLPPYIKRIEKHLIAKGMDQSRAIATSVNAAKKMCATGDLNFPGSQQVNPGSKAEACAAVADWEAKKAKAHAS
jgi:hypothetical protein